MTVDRSLRLFTRRLCLRPTVPGDVERALDIRADTAVARNLVSATIPPDRDKMIRWFNGHADEWQQQTAHRLVIELDGRMIGICDVFDIAEGRGEIGNWLDRTFWGRGYGLEAAGRLVQFAVETLGLSCLLAGCADDNTASAAILARLGFEQIDNVQIFSMSRQEQIIQRRFRLTV